MLFISDRGLPDMRVERSARTSKMKGNEVFFAGGPVKGRGLPGFEFEQCSQLPFSRESNLGAPYWWGRLKRRFRLLLECHQPDIVHAHDLIAARLASDFDVPFIYDDHEFWSFGSKIWRKGISPVNWYSRWLWAKWERRILARAGAVVTVSNTIAEEHSKWAKDVFVVPNLPTKAEVESLPSDTQRPGKLSSAYIGRVTPPFIPYRDVTGFVDLFADGKLGDLTVIGDGQLRSTTRVSSAGLLPHQEMMFQLGKNHFGMIPWKKHWFHKYCNPNKAYEYAHCGLVVLCIDDLEPVVEALTPMCETFGDYHELVEILASYRGGVEELEDRRVRIIEFARKTLLYDRYEGVLLEAYRRAIRQG